MTSPARLHQYSFQDYLTVEEISVIKHEFLDGEIYAMAGGTVLHAALSASVLSLLHTQLRGRCRVFSADLRIRSLATGLASYPDVTVVCGPIETDPESKDTVVNPTAVVEVLSPGTIHYDLGEKFEHYKQIPTLKTVVYVWQDVAQIEVRERADDTWQSCRATAGQRARISNLDVWLDVDVVYEGSA